MREFFKDLLNELIRDYRYAYDKREYVLYFLERIILLKPARKTKLYNTVVYDGQTINDMLEDQLWYVMAKLHILGPIWRKRFRLDNKEDL